MEIYLNREYRVLYKIHEDHIECESLETLGRFTLIHTKDIIHCLKEKIFIDVFRNKLIRIPLRDFVRRTF